MSSSWKAVLVTAPWWGPPTEERSHSIGSKTVNSAVPRPVILKSCRSAI